MACDCETVEVSARYFVDVEHATSSTINRYGPDPSIAEAVKLLNTLAARSDVKKATIIREVI